ncbi:metallophosphoesterase [Nocardioides mesophilus]|uniref:Serine/threonine protein phosphatase n=1 Tax=Nocardioides mesophilus TaxID=433659 RepID=A0A7G9R9K1_9ACTN|nr:metallophosphoesterase [Nocardioides mesophilus]QNN52276.1 serine/threonine protein phosphatase [Nocardioides mesophilus]
MSSLYVVSDIHGYAQDLRDSLGEAGLVDGEDRWTGGDRLLYVLGDLMDRGPDGIGALRLVRSLQRQAPEQVHVLMGNHEALALGYKLFPQSRFGQVWQPNGGHASDQDALTDDDVEWLRQLPVMARVDEFLLMHSDANDYLEWGGSVEEINATVTSLLTGGDDGEALWEVFASLTARYDFTGPDGQRAAHDMLNALGGECIVHGHSIIGSLLNKPSDQVEGAIAYADGLVVAIDGGRYDGGPLLLVQLS